MRRHFFAAIHRSSLVLLALVAISATGCGLTSNRWAMSDPVYFAKYQHASDNSLPAKLVRLSDASHVSGRAGSEVGFSGGSQYGSGDLSGFAYLNSMVETRFGLVGLVGDTNDAEKRDSRALGGVHFGARLQPPTRFAPFIGLGLFAGAGDPEWQPAPDKPNQPDELGEPYRVYTADELFESREQYKPRELDSLSSCECEDKGDWKFTDGQVAAYPEFGIHYWIAPDLRLTASARYHITTDGSDNDSWNYGVSLGFID